MSPSTPYPAPLPVYPRPLSDTIYDCSPNDTNTVIDRLCNVVQMLVEDKSRAFQLRVLDRLDAIEPNPNQQELFS